MMPDRQSLPHAVVFDLDGTLVDSAPDLHVCANQLLAELDLPALSLAQVTGFIGEGIPPLIERCLAAAGCPATGATLDAAITRYKAIYAATPAGLTRPYPGVLDCLAQLQRRDVRLGVCTNKSEPLAREVLDALDMTRFFQAIVGGDTLPVRKPDPAPLQHVARLLAGATGNLVYVGDSEVDAATAVAARVPFVLFTRGYRKVPADSLPHAVQFDDFDALTGLLTGLSCRP
jgi:phosphoglycolate phosphatase